MELQIQKNPVAFADEIPHDRRTVAHKSLKSDLDEPADAAQLASKTKDVFPGGAVDGYDQSVSRSHAGR